MESLEKSLKTSFVGAANQITQLYTNSLNFQKQSYTQGYNQATRDILEFIIKNYSQNTRTIPVENLIEFLKNKVDSPKNPFDLNFSGPKSEVEQDMVNDGRNVPNMFFSFLPPENPQVQQTTQDLPNTIFTQDMPIKKRQFETPTNSMDYCYPDQFYKKSRVTG